MSRIGEMEPQWPAADSGGKPGGAAIQIVDGQSIVIRFRSRVSVLIKVGPGTYSDNYDREDVPAGGCQSNTAEVYLRDHNGDPLKCRGKVVHGYADPDEVLALLNKAANQ